jgi:hypothetical protein
MASSPSSSDPLGIVEELRCALSQPELAEANDLGLRSSVPARQAAFELARALGRCRLFGVDAGDLDGSLPAQVALAAASEFVEWLATAIADAERLPRDWEACDEPFEADDLSLDLLITRMDAWAAFLTIDEAYQKAIEARSPAAGEFHAPMDQVLDALNRLDQQLLQRTDYLEVAGETELLDNWRHLLADEFRVAWPWWLDGRLETVSGGVAVTIAPAHSRDRLPLPFVAMAADVAAPPPVFSQLVWTDPQERYHARMLVPRQCTSEDETTLRLRLNVYHVGGPRAIELAGTTVWLCDVPRELDPEAATNYTVAELRHTQRDLTLAVGQRNDVWIPKP